MANEIQLGRGNHSMPPENLLGIGFNIEGQLVRINTDGSETIYEPNDINPQSIVANKGVGLYADLPSTGISVGDIYVTTDTHKIYTAIDSVSWSIQDLGKGQFITDVLDGLELPPLYQFYNNTLMHIANVVTNLPPLP